MGPPLGRDSDEEFDHADEVAQIAAKGLLCRQVGWLNLSGHYGHTPDWMLHVACGEVEKGFAVVPQLVPLTGQLPPLGSLKNLESMKAYFTGAIAGDQWDLCSVCLKLIPFRVDELAACRFRPALVTGMHRDSSISCERWVALFGRSSILFDDFGDLNGTLSNVPFPPFKQAYEILEKEGITSSIKWDCPELRCALRTALSYGNVSPEKAIEFVQFCLEKEVKEVKVSPDVCREILEDAFSLSVPAVIRVLTEYFSALQNPVVHWTSRMLYRAVSASAANTAFVVELMGVGDPELQEALMCSSSDNQHTMWCPAALQWLLDNRQLSSTFWDLVADRATEFGVLETLRFLLNNQPRIVVHPPNEDTIQTALRRRVSAGLRTLHGGGISVRINSIEGWEPLCRTLEDVQVLVEICGIDPNAKNTVGENLLMRQLDEWWHDWELTPGCLRYQGQMETLEYCVVKAGVDIYCPIHNRWNIFSLLVTHGELDTLRRYIELQPPPPNFAEVRQHYGTIFHHALGGYSMLHFVVEFFGHEAARTKTVGGEGGQETILCSALEKFSYRIRDRGVEESLQAMRYLLEEVHVTGANYDAVLRRAVKDLRCHHSCSESKALEEYLCDRLEKLHGQPSATE